MHSLDSGPAGASQLAIYKTQSASEINPRLLLWAGGASPQCVTPKLQCWGYIV